MDAEFARSNSRIRSFTDGVADLMLRSVSSRRLVDRPARITSAGFWAAIARAASAPRPLGLHPVMRTTLPLIFSLRAFAASPAVVSFVNAVMVPVERSSRK